MVLAGKFTFKDSAWKHVSKEAQEFIKSLLTPESKRPTAKEALEHDWFAKEAVINAEHTMETGPVMATFNAK